MGGHVRGRRKYSSLETWCKAAHFETSIQLLYLFNKQVHVFFRFVSPDEGHVEQPLLILGGAVSGNVAFLEIFEEM